MPLMQILNTICTQFDETSNFTAKLVGTYLFVVAYIAYLGNNKMPSYLRSEYTDHRGLKE